MEPRHFGSARAALRSCSSIMGRGVPWRSAGRERAVNTLLPFGGHLKVAEPRFRQATPCLDALQNPILIVDQ